MVIIKTDQLGDVPKYPRGFSTGSDDWRNWSQVRLRASVSVSGELVDYDYLSMETVKRMGVAGYMSLMIGVRLTDENSCLFGVDRWEH